MDLKQQKKQLESIRLYHKLLKEKKQYKEKNKIPQIGAESLFVISGRRREELGERVNSLCLYCLLYHMCSIDSIPILEARQDNLLFQEKMAS